MKFKQCDKNNICLVTLLKGMIFKIVLLKVFENIFSNAYAVPHYTPKAHQSISSIYEKASI